MKKTQFGKSKVGKICSVMLLFMVVIALVAVLQDMIYMKGREKWSAPVETSDEFEDKVYSTSNSPWYLTLVNKWNPIPEDYDINLIKVEGGERIDERIYEPLMEMFKDAMESNWGQMPIVVSGYRTHEKQQRIFEDEIADYRNQGYSDSEAQKLAEQWVALPGYSEHQLGIAVDINGATYDVFPWLQENSYKYGFILRYPGDKTELTGTAEEIWHYRYVGTEVATEIHEQGICLEEYLENLNNRG